MSETKKWAHEKMQVSKRAGEDPFAFMGGSGGRGNDFPIGEVSGEQLGEAVKRWCALGHAISFGLSGDAGAFGVHLISGGRKRSKWFGDVAAAEDWLTTVPGPNGAE